MKEPCQIWCCAAVDANGSNVFIPISAVQLKNSWQILLLWLLEGQLPVPQGPFPRRRVSERNRSNIDLLGLVHACVIEEEHGHQFGNCQIRSLFEFVQIRGLDSLLVLACARGMQGNRRDVRGRREKQML